MSPIDTNYSAKGIISNTADIATRSQKTLGTHDIDHYNNLKLGQIMTGALIDIKKDGTASIKFNNFTLSVKMDVAAEIGSKVTVSVVALGSVPIIKVESVVSPTDPRLSSLGKSISAITAQADKLGLGSEISSDSPVAANAETIKEPVVVTKLLQNTINHSGLFYESHLVKWIQGGLQFDQLLKEPQASYASNTKLTSGAADKGSLDSPVLHIVNTQLQALDSSAITWHGHIWPGQEMSWHIKKDKNASDADIVEHQTLWSTSITLELPNLGKVDMQISLNSSFVQLKIDASDPETQDILKNQHTILTEALSRAGITTTRLNIQHNV